jgi:hypothetical protein
MKNLIILFLVVLSFVCCKNANTQKPENTSVSDTSFKMTLSDYYEERSKDSHNYSKTYSVESGVLYYDYLYRGYPDDEEFHDKKQMNDSLISKIKLKIEELSLYRNYEKKFPSDESGYFTESGSTLSVTTDTEKYYIKISGPRPIEIDDEVYNKLSEFYYFLDSVFPQKP